MNETENQVTQNHSIENWFVIFWLRSNAHNFSSFSFPTFFRQPNPMLRIYTMNDYVW
jgi:hypothetical protein